jgi:hypothetical protein
MAIVQLSEIRFPGTLTARPCADQLSLRSNQARKQ